MITRWGRMFKACSIASVVFGVGACFLVHPMDRDWGTACQVACGVAFSTWLIGLCLFSFSPLAAPPSALNAVFPWSRRGMFGPHGSIALAVDWRCMMTLVVSVLPVSLQNPIFVAGVGSRAARAGQESVMTQSLTAASRLKACRACRRRIFRRPPADRRDPGGDSALHHSSFG